MKTNTQNDIYRREHVYVHTVIMMKYLIS